MAADKFDLLGPAMSEVGRETMAVVGGTPDRVFLFVEAGEGWVDASPFKEEEDHVRYYDPSDALCDALFNLWYTEEPEKRWTEMRYTIDGGRFHADFEFENLHLPNDGSDDRRQSVLRARYGNKTVIYPGLRAGDPEYHHKP